MACQLFQFAGKMAIENIHVQPNGWLLLSTLHTGNLFSLDPRATTPQPSVVVSLPGATGLTGIATIDAAAGIFAVGGGEHVSFGFTPGTVAVYVVQIDAHHQTGRVLDRISVDAVVNGVTNMPQAPHIVLAADSKGSRVMRIDTRTRHVDVAIADASLSAGNGGFPLGINGARVRYRHLYFTNSGQGTFARVPIDASGGASGHVEILATLLQKPAAASNAYDDFTFDRHGNAYIALHSGSYVKVTPDGTQTVFINRTDTDGSILEPTSAALSNDGKMVYLCTAGTTVDGVMQGGQVLAAGVPHSV